MSEFSLLVTAALALGAILGSFLNAFLFRFNTGTSVMRGRSRCMRCGHTLGVGDLVPIFSYLWLRGRCRWCGTHISLQYPIVEAAAALLSLGVLLAHPEPIAFAFWLVVWLVVLAIVVYDLRHMIIPWSFSLPLLVLAVASAYFFSPWPQMYLISGVLLAAPIFFLSAVSGGRWMGWADSVFELSLGIMLGFSQGFTGLLLAVWSGAFVGILLLWLSKRATMKSEIPFAPFLAAGAAVAYFFHVDFFQTLSFY